MHNWHCQPQGPQGARPRFVLHAAYLSMMSLSLFLQQRLKTKQKVVLGDFFDWGPEFSLVKDSRFPDCFSLTCLTYVKFQVVIR